ncbi:hypothetical protein CSUNSWCD_2388 [Campylobacter showae CSUNSWCD]|uniref:Uncharacterized protein n=1 Tax=Campylobacter showae CSUNSWCD TaxID=1244083 RepID=M5IEP8_9BACT|nr:hypothetical protein CSUNSWCD_2388 [Campylobacter showae CSUNSWCD]
MADDLLRHFALSLLIFYFHLKTRINLSLLYILNLKTILYKICKF